MCTVFSTLLFFNFSASATFLQHLLIFQTKWKTKILWAVPRRSMTRILMEGTRLIALSGRRTRIVLIAVRFMLSKWRQYSNAPAMTIKQSFQRCHKKNKIDQVNKWQKIKIAFVHPWSRRFQESPRYPSRPHTPIATIFITISMAK